jgi:uncharacterized OB-fold protein
MPVTRGEEAVFFSAAREHRLLFQRCRACGATVFYLRTVCPACHTEALTLEESSGRGTVHSFTVQHRAADPYTRARLPMKVVLVDLEEGFRLLGDLVGPDDVHVDMPVEVVWDDVSEELTLPRFRRLAGEESAR